MNIVASLYDFFSNIICKSKDFADFMDLVFLTLFCMHACFSRMACRNLLLYYVQYCIFLFLYHCLIYSIYHQDSYKSNLKRTNEEQDNGFQISLKFDGPQMWKNEGIQFATNFKLFWRLSWYFVPIFFHIL